MFHDLRIDIIGTVANQHRQLFHIHMAISLMRAFIGAVLNVVVDVNRLFVIIGFRHVDIHNFLVFHLYHAHIAIYQNIATYFLRIIDNIPKIRNYLKRIRHAGDFVSRSRRTPLLFRYAKQNYTAARVGKSRVGFPHRTRQGIFASFHFQ